jgi:hypothetical protein
MSFLSAAMAACRVSCGTGSSADLQVIKPNVNPPRILADKFNRQGTVDLTVFPA